ncbi:5-dehydro-4-deoxyglucarate dehydratase [Bosea caraganae]|uniref:Probable 5-dehydro-4-deoxyglucarate dehydratase n=1 Tax=Bosea caraganae TaxID=2763117 RepID=A0A370LAY5_9HYPH|nr:5-dehydro-4-deoxyglucarate dehydratase [Bosea caraganae]RDJ22077.1 5-dehydro-4-deoxyglucarate dehydratase [Bosea caraganae]RDJ28340.1 5-dehydro-4-deoxyglucarate dehydratase [Bosea caraganae]
MDCQELKARVGQGLLSFPVTYFDKHGEFDAEPYRASVARAASHGPAALFAAGGTGEFFSLGFDEYPAIIRTAVEAAQGEVPIIAGCGYGTRMAVHLAQAAEAAGADGILLLPHYLIYAEQAGLYAHVKAVCDAVKIGVIVYNRDNAIISADTLIALTKACPNLVGFKDGHGDIEQVQRITTLIGDRLTYVGGMPTAEVYAAPYYAAGVTTYSSAVYNFIPQAALRFYEAIAAGEKPVIDDMLRRFFYPYLQIRNRGRGYAVSIVKAGMRIMGEDPGPVRSPLTDLTPAEHDDLERLLNDAFDGKPA